MGVIVRFLSEQWFGVMSLIIGIIASYIFYKRGCKEKKPMYTLTSNKMIVNEVSDLGPLKILYDNQEVPNVTATDAVFWNDGKETIQFDDIASADPVRFVVEAPCEILTARLINASSPANKLLVEQVDKTSVEIRFDYLDKGQGGFFQILHTGIKPDTLQLKGSIKGAGEPRAVVSKKRWLVPFFAAQLILIILMGFLMGKDAGAVENQLYDMWDYSLTRLKEEYTRREYLLKTLDELKKSGTIDIEMQRQYLDILEANNEAAGKDLERLKTIHESRTSLKPYINICFGAFTFLSLIGYYGDKIKMKAYPKGITRNNK